MQSSLMNLIFDLLITCKLRKIQQNKIFTAYFQFSSAKKISDDLKLEY